MYRCTLEVRADVIAAMKPGLTITNLQDIAEEVYKKHGLPLKHDDREQQQQYYLTLKI